MVAYKKIYFICSVYEANVIYSRDRGRKTIPGPQLEFCRKLVLGMLENNLDDEGVSTNYPICHKKRSIGPGSTGHELVSHGLHDNLLSFALLPRPTPNNPGPVGGRR